MTTFNRFISETGSAYDALVGFDQFNRADEVLTANSQWISGSAWGSGAYPDLRLSSNMVVPNSESGYGAVAFWKMSSAYPDQAIEATLINSYSGYNWTSLLLRASLVSTYIKAYEAYRYEDLIGIGRVWGDGGYTALAQMSGLSNPSTTELIRFQVTSNYLQLFVNSVEMLNCTDTDSLYVGGHSGLKIQLEGANWEDFKIFALGKTVGVGVQDSAVSTLIVAPGSTWIRQVTDGIAIADGNHEYQSEGRFMYIGYLVTSNIATPPPSSGGYVWNWWTQYITKVDLTYPVPTEADPVGGGFIAGQFSNLYPTPLRAGVDGNPQSGRFAVISGTIDAVSFGKRWAINADTMVGTIEYWYNGYNFNDVLGDWSTNRTHFLFSRPYVHWVSSYSYDWAGSELYAWPKLPFSNNDTNPQVSEFQYPILHSGQLAAGCVFAGEWAYWADTQKNRILRLSAHHLDGNQPIDDMLWIDNPVLSFGSLGSGSGEFNWPRHLAVNPERTLMFVYDFLNHRNVTLGLPDLNWIDTFDVGSQAYLSACEGERFHSVFLPYAGIIRTHLVGPPMSYLGGFVIYPNSTAEHPWYYFGCVAGMAEVITDIGVDQFDGRRIMVCSDTVQAISAPGSYGLRLYERGDPAFLFEFMIDSPVYYTDHERPIFCNSVLFSPAPVRMTDVKRSQSSPIEDVTLTVQNADRKFSQAVGTTQVEGRTCRIRKTYWTSPFSHTPPHVLYEGLINSYRIDEAGKNATVAVELRNDFWSWDVRVPKNAFSTQCQWMFKSTTPGCQYVQHFDGSTFVVASECGRTWADCKVRENTDRFRGYRFTEPAEREIWWGKPRNW